MSASAYSEFIAPLKAQGENMNYTSDPVRDIDAANEERDHRQAEQETAANLLRIRYMRAAQNPEGSKEDKEEIIRGIDLEEAGRALVAYIRHGPGGALEVLRSLTERAIEILVEDSTDGYRGEDDE